MDPDEAEKRFAEMLEAAGLPRFASTLHDPALDELQFTWDHGLTIHMDLTRARPCRAGVGRYLWLCRARRRPPILV